ncbi:PD-(D/E)XK nuclease family protein [Thiobacillus sp.]|uniref:PD-(D/E)XK nuclease family protein n=1 Tax=Thiobacillus sp. TaxID=924 RepID=UPI0025D49EA0|nr:PD-(D/E)XK nuclease family protein [Thiobacillus sp.]
MAIATISLKPDRQGASLPAAVARHLLDHHADRLPDLSGLTVLVPNQRAGQDFARLLAQAAGLPVLIPPHIVPLKSWAADMADARPGEPQARRLARLHGVLRREAWLGNVDKWALANELLGLADELSAARLGGDVGSQIRALQTAALDRETALIEAVWQALNTGGNDPQARYAAALERVLAQLAGAPRPLYGYALGTLTAVEQQFLERCAGHTAVTLFELATDSSALTHSLQQAWQCVEPPIVVRAAGLASAYTNTPVAARICLNPAPHLEAEARAIATWVALQLQDGKRDLALIALDRETARRVRALLERMAVRVADETGWTLSTTAAAAVIDRWLECVASDFPHTELLDLLKSPFLLGELALRQDAVLQLELALRRQGVAQGMADIQRLAQGQFGALPPWLAALFGARQKFTQTRAPLAVWVARLLDSLVQLDASLQADAAGAQVLETLESLRQDLGDDSEKYSFGEWRRWLNLALESANFSDASVASSIVLTSLPAARGRVFEAIAVIGADARHLPAAPAPGLFSQATRAQLGLSTAAAEAAAATADLIQLLGQGNALLSWQAWHDDEPNPASPLVLRLQALHLAAWGSDLPQQGGAEPPACSSSLPSTCTQAAPAVQAAQLPQRYAPTAYQTLLDCPYRFFVKSVLGIRELDEADDALDKSDYGNALHRILKNFHDRQPPVERAAALAYLGEVSAAEFAGLPAYTATVWARRWAAIQPAYVDAWLASEAAGWRYQSGETAFEMPYAVAGLGEITLHGRIDRVDRRTDAGGGEALAVIDYKTGASQGLKARLKNPAEAVQLPFYAWLAEAAAAYLPINETPVVSLALDGETDIDAICRRLPALLAAMAAGAALPAGGVDGMCQHCEARGLCRKGMWEEAAAAPAAAGKAAY